MDIRVVTVFDASYDTRVIGLYEGESCSVADSGIQAMVDHLRKAGDFTGEFGEILSLRIPREEAPAKLILAGLGKQDAVTADRLRKVVARIIKEANKSKTRSLCIEPLGISETVTLETATRIIAEIPLLADYKFDKYQQEKKASTVQDVNILCGAERDRGVMEAACREGSILAKETVFARELVNEPANVLLPVELARRAKEAGERYGFEVELLDETAIKELGMEAFMAVTQASDNPPRLIVMRYFGDGENREKLLGMAGKGLTYDSGGLCIKTKAGMVNMKCDMGGAAAVIGAMSAIAQMKLKANVVSVVAACENMISGRAYRTGDIIGSMAGKTIFIGSTDAEGRLTLADAVHYLIEKEKVGRVLDIATLTGAASIALGNVATAVLSNDDDFYRELLQASEISGEKIWRLPCFDEYKESLKSNVADLTNSAGNPGTITAGMFIQEFVQKKPWIHMDIAATAWIDKASDLSAEGGTGVAVRTLYYLVKNTD